MTALLLFACTLEPAQNDLDGDGYTTSDCDDADDDVHPVADEACDGIDNDCDLSIDDGACTNMDIDDHATVIVTGEDGLGPAVAVGQLDGDGFGDLVTQARFADAPAVCVIPGARLVAGVLGGTELEATISEVASCWIVEGTLLGLATTSAAAFGQPASDVAWTLSAEDGLCAIDPFGEGLTLETAAFGCSGLALWEATGISPVGLTHFGPADTATATLMAATTEGVGIAAATDLYGGPGEFWGLVTTVPLTGLVGGDDVDGDGVGDILAADAGQAWVISSDFGATIPIELAGLVRVEREERDIQGTARVGDLDGDGTSDWAIVTNDGLMCFSGSEWLGDVGAVVDALPAGDFNGDDEPDLIARLTGGVHVGILLGPVFDDRAVPDARVYGDASTFGEGLAAIDVDADGYDDLWITDPQRSDEEQVSATGVAYLLSGFGVMPEE